MTTLDRFYPVVPDAHHVALMLEAGARLIQLRIKDRSQDQLLEEVRRAIEICKTAGAQLVVNDYWQIALAAGADFVHLGQEDLLDADVPLLRRHSVRLGISTHDEAELEIALGYDPDYVALGPIWPTTLKVMPWAPQGVQRITEWRRRVGDRPLVAIGGITAERAQACLAAGASAVAVVNDVVNHADPVARARAWVQATREAL